MKNNRSIRILLVEDHAMFREAITRLIAQASDLSDFRVAESTQEAEMILNKDRIDLVLLDLNLEVENTLKKIAPWRARFPATRILVLSGTINPAIIREALEAGAYGFVSKLDSSAELLAGIRQALANQPVRPKRSHRDLPTHGNHSRPILSRRESEVLREIAEGKTVRQISETLGISPKTVERHKENMKLKLKLESAPELMREALRVFPQVQ